MTAMKAPTKKEIIAAGRAEMARWLRAAEAHGTIYYAVEHVSRSGMSRRITLATIVPGDDGPPTLERAWPRLLDWEQVRDWHSYGHALDVVARDLDFSFRHRTFVVGGCGMDIVFALVNDLAHRCLGDDGRGYANRVRRENMLGGG